MDTEIVCYTVEQSHGMPYKENVLNAIHLLRPGIGNALRPSVVNWQLLFNWQHNYQSYPLTTE